MDSVRLVQGCVALAGPTVDNIAATYSSTISSPSRLPPHITLFTKSELRTLLDNMATKDANSVIPAVDISYLIPIGLSTKRDVSFVVVVWNAGQAARKKAGLPPKDFHITLSSVDDHSLDKSILSLPSPPQYSNFALDQLDHICYAYEQQSQYQLVVYCATHMILANPASLKGFLRLADASFQLSLYKLAMLAYARVLAFSDSTPTLTTHCLQDALEVLPTYGMGQCIWAG